MTDQTTYSVRIRTEGSDRGGAASSDWLGEHPEPKARDLAEREAKRRGGTVTEWAHSLTVIVPKTKGPGRPEIGPSISLRMPRDLLERLDAHAEATGTTRSDLIRAGAELVLQQPEGATDE